LAALTLPSVQGEDLTFTGQDSDSLKEGFRKLPSPSTVSFIPRREPE
jgi:hypothetical protein